MKHQITLRAFLRVIFIGFLLLSHSYGKLPQAHSAYLSGDYTKVLELTKNTNPQKADFISLEALRMQTLLETGKIREALDQGLKAHSKVKSRTRVDPELTLALAQAYRQNGKAGDAQAIIAYSMSQRSNVLEFHRREKPIHFAELLLANKVDAKTVLKEHLQPIREKYPEKRHIYQAIGRLALQKHDRQLAGEVYQEGLKRFPNDPEFLLGLAKCRLELPPSLQNPEKEIRTYTDLALVYNPRYPDALLQKAKFLADKKSFKQAKEYLQKILEINPHHSNAWALKCSIFILEDNWAESSMAWDKAHQYSPENPEVPEIIGNSLASHYRFKEAISFLQIAQTRNPSSPSILFSLGSNQLRYGQYSKGWMNVESAHKLDPYHVSAFNLITLHDKIQNYPILEKDGVQIRMSPEDSIVFGQQALKLAVDSKNILAEKYGVSLTQPVLIEMLPRQEDFAIRTLGLPGGESFLGVCFGPLITMTSPRGRLGRANWESVLWHEMAHTITLEATLHRIPRWLTEGISVYEERQVREGWGQAMTGTYRQRYLDDDYPPISTLNETFSSRDVMFAYYHSSLIVEFLVEQIGIEGMRSLLSEIGSGERTEVALTNQLELSLAKIESAIDDYVKKQAQGYGSKFDWTPLSDAEYLNYREDPKTWVAENPNRYHASSMLLSELLENNDWQNVKMLAQELIEKEPNNREKLNPYSALAKAHRAAGNEEEERLALTELLRLDSNQSEASRRLLQLSTSLRSDEKMAHADRVLETNPFSEEAYRTISEAALVEGKWFDAMEAIYSLIALEPLDQSLLHYKLAKLLERSSPQQARLEILKALEQNPRFEAALQLLSTLPSSL